MLNAIRRSAQSIVIKGLLVLLTLSFMAWGVESYINVNAQLPVVEASGWNIGPQEFSQAHDEEFERLKEQFNGALDKKTADQLGLKQRTLQALINRHLILTAARDLRLTVSPNTLRQRINSSPAFQVDGQFNKEQYERILRQNRLTPKSFEAQLQADMVSDQIRRAITTPIAIPKALRNDIYRMDNERRAIVTLQLDPKELEPAIQPADAELQAYRDQHPAPFMTKAKVKLRYALLTADSVRDMVKVSDEELKEFYQDHIREYRKEENRQVRHILARIDDKNSAEVAQEKIAKATAKLKAGETFENVAKELSDDVSAAQGGDLGLFGPGVMVPEFDQVAFSLEKGKVSDPVTTPFGIHLIRVDQIQAGEVKPLENVSAEIRGRIVEHKAKDLVYERSVTFEDQLAASGNLKTIANDLNLRYRETDFLARDEPGLSGVELDAKFLETAFSTPKGSLSPLVELANGQFLALEVVDREEPSPKPMEQIKEELTKATIADKARNSARQIMEQVVKALGEGKSIDELKAMHDKLRVVTPAPFLRTGAETEPGARIREAAFKLHPDKPNHGEILDEAGHLSAIRLVQIHETTPDQAKEPDQEWLTKMERIMGQDQLFGYLNGLWSRANIRVHQEVLDRL
ncbi:MAG: hypothetical protein G8237_00690 [Magnetococcales bacterium]|nr:SurA N-terminal domain-containing protein [Magnetococcales bacterium]NGZ04854.1 hypothetical protein [Magnetococcales bacterium]